jgi:hypothetical protein
MIYHDSKRLAPGLLLFYLRSLRPNATVCKIWQVLDARVGANQ